MSAVLDSSDFGSIAEHYSLGLTSAMSTLLRQAMVVDISIVIMTNAFEVYHGYHTMMDSGAHMYMHTLTCVLIFKLVSPIDDLI